MPFTDKLTLANLKQKRYCKNTRITWAEIYKTGSLMLAGITLDFWQVTKMALKRIAIVCLVFIGTSYLIALLDKSFIFALFFPIVVISAIALVTIVIFSVFKLALDKLIFQKSRKDGRPQKAFNILIGLISLIVSIILPLILFRLPTQQATPNTQPDISALKSLPYVSWAPAEDSIDKSGVTRYDPVQTFEGINIFTSVGTIRTRLIDMQGRTLHEWSADDKNRKWDDDVEVRPNGDLLVIDNDRRLLKLDFDSNIIWVNTDFRYHHEIAPAENGDLYVLGMKDKMTFIAGLPVPILNDHIVIISAQGKTKRSVTLLPALRDRLGFDRVALAYRWIITPKNFQKVLKRRYAGSQGTRLDVFHNNTITIVERQVPGFCKKNQLLICVRDLDLVGLFDIEQRELIWSWGPGHLSRPHHPTLLENGNILIYDNGRRRGRSRIIELDPKTNTIMWQYEATPPDTFFSQGRGSAQRLPNGNTLITESYKGRVFEVTSEEQIVWEFYNPDIDEATETRSTIYRMIRLINPQDYPALSQINTPVP